MPIPERDDSWITSEFIEAYSELHHLGWAHSIEVWDSDREAGWRPIRSGDRAGLFAGESMFHRTTDASKVALVHLVVVMNEGGGSLLDVQWQTPHLESLGAEIIGREVYLAELEKALTLSGPFAGSSNDPKG